MLEVEQVQELEQLDLAERAGAFGKEEDGVDEFLASANPGQVSTIRPEAVSGNPSSDLYPHVYLYWYAN